MLMAGARWRWLTLNRIDGAAIASTLTTWFENLARYNGFVANIKIHVGSAFS